MKKVAFSIIALICFYSCSKKESVVANVSEDNDNPQEVLTSSLLRVENRQIVDENSAKVKLQGMAFNNYIWEDGPLHNPDHHSEIDYTRVRNMGMNVVRFYMNYQYLEDDNNPYNYLDTGWEWLDKNIEWAKNNGVYLILNMHAPQGGYQSQGQGDALWDITENQNRLTALWQEIAERYKNESQIVGYGLVNEPIPTNSIDKWSALAQQLIDGIRSIGDEHIIFVEQAIRIKNNTQNSVDFDFPSVSGNNIVYEFHDYNPYFFTHQLLEFAQLGEGGTYPDETVFETQNSEWHTAIFNNPKLDEGNSDWSYLEGVTYTVDDPEIAFAIPTLYGSRLQGKVWFDDFSIEEYDSNGDFIRTVFSENLNNQGTWSFWSQDDSGGFGISTTEGNGDATSIFIEATNQIANLGNYTQRFIPVQGNSYRVNAWLKGENIAAAADAGVGVDFYTVDGELLLRNKSFLRQNLEGINAWAIAKNVPLYLGEFGTGLPTFENDKGGLKYVEDMLDIIEDLDIPFTYHAYHEDAFGLYKGYGLPDPANTNQTLIDYFTLRLDN